MSTVRFTDDGALGVLTVDSPPLNLIGEALIGEALIGDLLAAVEAAALRRSCPRVRPPRATRVTSAVAQEAAVTVEARVRRAMSRVPEEIA
jgi:hypothetical protein